MKEQPGQSVNSKRQPVRQWEEQENQQPNKGKWPHNRKRETAKTEGHQQDQ
jgi:hypothetical protein